MGPVLEFAPPVWTPITTATMGEPSIIDGPRSVVFDQADNRLHTEQALLLALTGGGHELDPVRCPTPAAEPALVR